MHTTYNQRLLPLALLGIIVVIGFSFLAIETPEQQVGLGAGMTSESYASNKDYFSEEILFSAALHKDGPMTITGNPDGLEGVFVYKKAYYGADSWEELTLEAQEEDQQETPWSENWIYGPADANIDFEDITLDGDELHITMFICRFYDLEDEDFLDTITGSQFTALENHFEDSTSGYICGLANIAEGTLIDNKWSLITPDLEDISTPSQECYDSTSVGTIGEKNPCNNMLIVNDTMLHGAASSELGGDESFRIRYEEVNYTFADSENNIFTGQVTDMASLFYNTDFNEDIGYWDVSNVEDMFNLFRGASSFDQDIGSWDVSNVEDMFNLFRGASSFNQNISCWNVTSFEEEPFNFSLNSHDNFNDSLKPDWGTQGC